MDPELKKTCLELLELIDYLQLPESAWPFKEISREEAKVRLANFFGLDFKDPRLLEKAREEINKILAGELKVESVPKKLGELVKEYEEHQKELAEQREAFLKRTYPTLNEQIRNALQTKYAHDLLTQLKESEKQLPEKERILTQNPERAEKASQQIADELAPLLPQTARIEAFSGEEYQEILKKAQPRIKEILERTGVTQSEKVSQIFIDQTVKKDLPLAQEVAATPRSFIKEAPPPRKKIAPEDLILPKNVATELVAEPDGVAFAHVFILHPQVATSFAKRTMATPAVETIKLAARISGEISPLEKEIIFKGLKESDIQKSIKFFKEKGLPDTHQIIIGLTQDSNELRRFADAHPFLRGAFDVYYQYPRLTGRVQIYSPSAKVYLPTTEPGPIWEKKRGFTWNLRQTLNLVGEKSGFYRVINLAPEKTIIHPALPNTLVRIFSLGKFPTTQALKSTITTPIISFLRKTPLSKIATGFLGKLGIGAGTAVAPGVGTAISLAISAAIEAGGKILGKIWDQIKLTIREPERFLPALGVAAVIAIVIPAPLGLIIAVPFAIAGSLGAISWGAASAGAVASGLAGKTVAFFTAVATLPITAPIALFTVGIISTIAAITFFIVMTTAGAFILPVGPTEIIPEVPPPPAPPVIPPPPGLTFRWPVDSPYNCSSNYGYRQLTINERITCDYHEGIDIPAFAGALVYSTAKGEVVSLGYSSGYGTYVVVKHDGLYSFYAHLQATATYVGEEVNQSSIIGYVDNTGRSFGTHLHFAFSSCGTVPSCFSDGSFTPDPCNYLTKANPACPESCGYRNKATGCPSL